MYTVGKTWTMSEWINEFETSIKGSVIYHSIYVVWATGRQPWSCNIMWEMNSFNSDNRFLSKLST